MNAPLVSVLSIGYNAAPFIPRMLGSIEKQTYSNWEFIFVDDGSSDNSEELVRQFSEKYPQRRIEYIRNPQNSGVGKSRLESLKNARGEYCAFHDADDFWEADHLQSLATLLESGSDIAFSPVTDYFEERQENGKTHYPTQEQLSDTSTGLFYSCFIQTASCIAFKKRIFETLGPFDPHLKIGEDWDYWLRASIAGYKIECAKTSTCHYVKHASNTMGKTLNVAQHEVLFYRKHLKTHSLPISLRKKLYAKSCYNLSRLIAKQAPRDAFMHAKQAFAYYPLEPKHAINLTSLFFRK